MHPTKARKDSNDKSHAHNHDNKDEFTSHLPPRLKAYRAASLYYYLSVRKHEFFRSLSATERRFAIPLRTSPSPTSTP